VADNRNNHLERACWCNACRWHGVVGKLIARDKLRCPKCDSVDVEYPIVTAPERMQ
jgi:Zn finger protein HypA/HybF involved in hydrogenase expression